MNCARCPCPDICRQLPAYCEWAARDPQEPREIRNICDASRRASAESYESPAAQSRPLEPGRPSVDESAELVRRMHACPFRAAGPKCGCAGAACALRAASIVSHRDCFACLQQYGDT